LAVVAFELPPDGIREAEVQEGDYASTRNTFGTVDRERHATGRGTSISSTRQAA
jgi:hypothetical protein